MKNIDDIERSSLLYKSLEKEEKIIYETIIVNSNCNLLDSIWSPITTCTFYPKKRICVMTIKQIKKVTGFKKGIIYNTLLKLMFFKFIKIKNSDSDSQYFIVSTPIEAESKKGLKMLNKWVLSEVRE